MKLRTSLLAGGVAIVFFAGATLAMNLMWPAPSRQAKAPVLADPPPLPEVTRTSRIVTPTAIALSAIRDKIDAAAPRNLSGKRDNPVPQLLSNADINWTMTRTPLTVSGRPDGLALSTTLSGTLHVVGQISGKAKDIGSQIGNLLGDKIGRSVQDLANRPIDQHADIRGNVVMTSKPALTPAWRLEPNMTAQVALADGAVSVAGMRLNVPGEVKPLVDRTVNDEVTALQARLRADPFIEAAARSQWTKLCRSIPLGAAGAGLPNLWLEIRPTQAFAAQPRIDQAALNLTVGVAAETRIVPAETKPDCPFPATLDIVPPMEEGKVNIGVPIDVPFTEVNRLLAPQLTGKTFPQDPSSTFQATIKSVSIVPSGDRLLISLGVSARETKSWFGLATEATVHVWGRPVLDSEHQTLRLTDIALDVDSETAFGLLGAAARAAVPYLKDALAANAVLDLKPFTANARSSIDAALADFRGVGPGVRVDAAITDLRVVGIAFDAKTLRVIAEANGNAKVAVSTLP